jgi:hypothetical protein
MEGGRRLLKESGWEEVIVSDERGIRG